MARRWIFYLAINILVSALTMLAVLTMWDRAQKPTAMPMVASPLGATPTGAPSATPGSAPSATPRIYIVKPGDVLGSIAVTLSVDMQSLIEINNIQDPDSLAPGDKLILPAPEPKNGSTNGSGDAHPTVTPGADSPQTWPVLVAALSPGKLPSEALRLTNAGETMNMKGWKIRAPSGEEYLFSDFKLVTGGAVMVYTGAGKDSSVSLYWNLTAPIWKAGAEALLLDETGGVRSVFLIPSE
jgi:LysM repeat protein